MTDENDDLDEFARLFGAKPETPPEGLIPPVPVQSPPAAGETASRADPLAWLVTPTPPVDEPPTALLPSADGLAATQPSVAPPIASIFPPAEPPLDPVAAHAPAPASASAPASAAAETTVFPTRRAAVAAETAATPLSGRRNLIILASVGAALLVLLIVLLVVLVGRFSTAAPVASPSNTGAPLASASATPSNTPSASPTPSVTPTPTAAPTATPTPAPTPKPTTAPAPPAPTLTAQVGNPPACTTSNMTPTFTISYVSTNATLITIQSSGADNYSNSSPTANGQFTNVKYACGASSPQPIESYSITATGPGSPPATVTLQVAGTGP